jgi:hypothetical protein
MAMLDGTYRKSRHSGANCVEVALLPGGEVGVRNSRDPDGVRHVFTAEEWAAFVLGVEGGEFDLPGSAVDTFDGTHGAATLNSGLGVRPDNPE